MRIANIQRFCMHDGPGIRTTVFLKGCPLRCAWCHNPETQSEAKELLYHKNKCIGCGECGSCSQSVHQFSQCHTVVRDLCNGCGECARHCPTNALEIVGTDRSVQELVTIIQRDSAFYGETGGVTLSGGEPFMQAEEALSLLKACKEAGIHTALETCGHFSPDILYRAVPLTDLFLWDIKDTDPERHRAYTGVSNKRIINNLYLADSLGARTQLRCILINGINTTAEHYQGIVQLCARLQNCTGVAFLPYHAFGGTKSIALGRPDAAKDRWIPSDKTIAEAKAYLRHSGIFVF